MSSDALVQALLTIILGGGGIVAIWRMLGSIKAEVSGHMQQTRTWQEQHEKAGQERGAAIQRGLDKIENVQDNHDKRISNNSQQIALNKQRLEQSA